MLDRIIANWPLKLLALVMAFVIWVSVTGENRVVQDFSVPLVVQLPDDRVLTSTPPTAITVRLRGSESLIRRFDPVLMAMQVALDNPDLGEHEIALTRTNLGRVPRGVEVEFIEPDRITLAVDERARREVPVEPTFLGQPPDGSAFYGATVTPDRLVIEGPRGDVDAIEVIRTSPIRLDRRSEPFGLSVTAVPDRPHVQVVDPAPVRVRVDVDTAPVKRRLDDLPIRLEGQRWVTTIAPERVAVELSGPPRLVDRVLPEQVRVVADVSGLEPSTQSQAVEIAVRLVDIPIEEMQRLTVSSVTRRSVQATVSERRFVR